MNSGKLLLQALIVAAALGLVSCTAAAGAGLGGAIPGSKVIATETLHPGAFEAIVVEYPADITIQQGAEDVVWIQADDNLLPQIAADVSSGTLTIKSSESDWKRRVNQSAPVKIAITVKNPKEIVLAAPVVTLQVNNIKAGALRLVLSGGGKVTVAGLRVDLLDAVLSGTGDMRVAGAAQELKILLSGWGNFNAAELASTKATVELSGAGDVSVQAEEALVATVNGAGSVTYYGHPQVQQTITGSGSVKPAGSDN